MSMRLVTFLMSRTKPTLLGGTATGTGMDRAVVALAVAARRVVAAATPIRRAAVGIQILLAVGAIRTRPVVVGTRIRRAAGAPQQRRAAAELQRAVARAAVAGARRAAARR